MKELYNCFVVGLEIIGGGAAYSLYTAGDLSGAAVVLVGVIGCYLLKDF